jgi:nucleotide-binding universal stress UspA family protein
MTIYELFFAFINHVQQLNKLAMTTILFPTDFSENSFHASQYAAMLAKHFDAKLVLLNVYSMVLPIVSESPMIFDRDDIVVRQQHDARQSLQVFMDNLIEKTGFPAEKIVQLLEYGLVTDVITETANSMDIDLIVMETHGASNMTDHWFGTNAEKIVELSNCPVWVLPENVSLAVPKAILYAADFKEDEVTATYELLAIAQPLGATCNVVHVHDYFESTSDRAIKEAVAELKDEFQNFDVTIKSINRVQIVTGLETYVRTHKPDVLAMAVYEKSFFSKLFSNSITEHFVQEAKIPLLFFKKAIY